MHDLREYKTDFLSIISKLSKGSANRDQYIAGFLFLSLALIPVVTTTETLFPIIGILYLMMFAMSWDVASGYMGALNFGHTFFIAVGGYTSAILNIQFGLSPLLSIPFAILLSAIAGLIIGLPTLRLQGAYFALVTLVVPNLFLQIVILFKEITGGARGMAQPPTELVGIAGNNLDKLINVRDPAFAAIAEYYLTLAILIFMYLFLYAYTRSNAGEILTAIREDENALRVSGINPEKHKVFSVILSSTLAGFAGALYVHSSSGFPAPNSLLTFRLSLDVIIIAVIGGIGTIVGSILGTILFGGIQFISTQVHSNVLGVKISDLIQISTFGIGMVIVYYKPGGALAWIDDNIISTMKKNKGNK